MDVGIVVPESGRFTKDLSSVRFVEIEVPSSSG